MTPLPIPPEGWDIVPTDINEASLRMELRKLRNKNKGKNDNVRARLEPCKRLHTFVALVSEFAETLIDIPEMTQKWLSQVIACSTSFLMLRIDSKACVRVLSGQLLVLTQWPTVCQLVHTRLPIQWHCRNFIGYGIWMCIQQ